MSQYSSVEMQITPFVTIITPVYNGAAFLDDLIISVLNQDYPFIEHIIIDDGSNDREALLAILEKYPHLRWWSRANQGQYATMNEGLQAAKGDLICFISADDILSAGAVSHAISFLRAHPEHVGVYGRYCYLDANKQMLWYQPLVQRFPIWFYSYYPALIAHCSLYIYKDCLTQNNLYFDPSLRFVGDYDWLSRIIHAGLKIGNIDHLLALVRWHSEQTSNTQQVEIKVEIKKILKKHGVNSFIFKAINSVSDRFLVARQLVMLILNGKFSSEIENVTKWLRTRKS